MTSVLVVLFFFSEDYLATQLQVNTRNIDLRNDLSLEK